jgi:raffinose/stachyose/melibiose transport system substrate-binding protein
MYIRIASNDFFAVSKDVVSKMIAGELTAEQAYQAFNAQLLADEEPADNETVLTSGKAYSNVFHANGGSAAFSVMANTLWHRCAACHRKQLYWQCAAGGL